MAEPTLKDVLNAISKLPTKADLDALRTDTKAEIASLRTDTKAEIASLRAEMHARFDDLDEELTLHAKVHKELEKDVTALKGRTPRTAARPVRRPRAR